MFIAPEYRFWFTPRQDGQGRHGKLVRIGGLMHGSRRDFLKSGLALGVVSGIGRALAQSGKRYATDMVPLGKSGVKVTRLAFGTGTRGGRVQRELGQEAFTRLVRHAYDSGIRFFETAESYPGMPEMLSIA